MGPTLANYDALWLLAALVPLGVAAAAWALQMSCGFCSVEPPEFWHAVTTVVMIAVANCVLRLVLQMTDSAYGMGPQYLIPALATSAVIALGVPTERVILEDESRNTREEAVVLKRLLAERKIDRFVIVTSPIHMGRSLAAFAVEGLHPVPSTSPLYPDRTAAPFPLTPNEVSLEIGNAVVYEWCARAYYWWRGWM